MASNEAGGDSVIEYCPDRCFECGALIPVTDNPSGCSGDILCRACRDKYEAEITEAAR